VGKAQEGGGGGGPGDSGGGSRGWRCAKGWGQWEVFESEQQMLNSNPGLVTSSASPAYKGFMQQFVSTKRQAFFVKLEKRQHGIAGHHDRNRL